jgi:hypothetical protein
MNLSDEIKKWPSIDPTSRQRQDQEEIATEQRLLRKTSEALVQLGKDTVKECRDRNHEMVGTFEVEEKTSRWNGSLKSVQFTISRRAWRIGYLVVDENGQFFEFERDHYSLPRGLEFRGEGVKNDAKARKEFYEREEAKALTYYGVNERVLFRRRLVPQGRRSKLDQFGEVGVVLEDGRLWVAPEYGVESSSYADLLEIVARALSGENVGHHSVGNRWIQWTG